MKRKELVNVLKSMNYFRYAYDDIKLVFHGDTLTFDRALMKSTLTNDVEPDREIVVNFKALLDVIKSLDGDDLLTITDGDTLITLPKSQDIEKYPITNPDLLNSFDHKISIPSDMLLKALNKIDFNASKDEQVRNLNGVYFDIKENGKLNLVAIDGYRMGVTALITETQEAFNGFVSLEMIKAVKALIKSKIYQENVIIKFGLFNDQKWSAIQCGKALEMYQIADIDYPDYNRVVPDTFQDVVKLSRKPVLETLKRMVKINKGYQEPCKIKMEFNHVNFSLKNPQTELSRSFTADITGDDLLMGFNPALLKDVFQNYKVDEITMKFQGENKPVVITSDDDPDTFYIVMPVRI